jgi:hypothetical protein
VGAIPAAVAIHIYNRCLFIDLPGPGVHRMKLFTCCLGMLAVCTILPQMGGCQSTPPQVPMASDPGIRRLNWLAGSWFYEDAKGVSEEHWTQPRAGTMIGMSRQIARTQGPSTEKGKLGPTTEKTAFFEYLRIEEQPGGEIVYLASPKGRQPATPFRLIELTTDPPRATFSNPEHDFPQRIVYWRDGYLLHGRIEGTMDGKEHTEDWTWTRK